MAEIKWSSAENYKKISTDFLLGMLKENPLIKQEIDFILKVYEDQKCDELRIKILELLVSTRAVAYGSFIHLEVLKGRDKTFWIAKLIDAATVENEFLIVARKLLDKIGENTKTSPFELQLQKLLEISLKIKASQLNEPLSVIANFSDYLEIDLNKILRENPISSQEFKTIVQQKKNILSALFESSLCQQSKLDDYFRFFNFIEKLPTVDKSEAFKSIIHKISQNLNPLNTKEHKDLAVKMLTFFMDCHTNMMLSSKELQELVLPVFTFSRNFKLKELIPVYINYHKNISIKSREDLNH